MSTKGKPDQEYLDTRSEVAHHQAEESGCIIVPADDYTLQLDLDSDADYWHYVEQSGRFLYLLEGAELACAYRSASGEGWHVIIRLPSPMPVKERIMWQLLLGSDPVREGLCLKRVLDGDPVPVLLFRPKSTIKSNDNNLDT